LAKGLVAFGGAVVDAEGIDSGLQRMNHIRRYPPDLVFERERALLAVCCTRGDVPRVIDVPCSSGSLHGADAAFSNGLSSTGRAYALRESRIAYSSLQRSSGVRWWFGLPRSAAGRRMDD